MYQMQQLCLLSSLKAIKQFWHFIYLYQVPLFQIFSFAFFASFALRQSSCSDVTLTVPVIMCCRVWFATLWRAATRQICPSLWWSPHCWGLCGLERALWTCGTADGTRSLRSVFSIPPSTNWWVHRTLNELTVLSFLCVESFVSASTIKRLILHLEVKHFIPLSSPAWVLFGTRLSKWKYRTSNLTCVQRCTGM